MHVWIAAMRRYGNDWDERQRTRHPVPWLQTGHWLQASTGRRGLYCLLVADCCADQAGRYRWRPSQAKWKVV